jgi:hypothetical protein
MLGWSSSVSSVSSSGVVESLSTIELPSELNSEYSLAHDGGGRYPEVGLPPWPALDEGLLGLNANGPLLSGRNLLAFDSRIDTRFTDPKILAKGPSRTAILNPRMKMH